MFLALAGRFLYQRDTRKAPRLILYDHFMTTVILRLSQITLEEVKIINLFLFIFHILKHLLLLTLNKHIYIQHTRLLYKAQVSFRGIS